MLITRAKATALLNQKEMELYTDSRVNVLRRLDAKALTARVGRARTARDRARDLVQRQKLASREATGAKRGNSGAANARSKDKATLLSDILSRFESQLRQVERAEKKAAKAASSSSKRETASKKPESPGAGRKTAGRSDGAATRGRGTDAGTGAGKAAAAKEPARQATTAQDTGRDTRPVRAGAAKKPRAARQSLTPEQALERTRQLLEAKQEQARQPKPWETIGGSGDDTGTVGYQSEDAARRAEQLHEAEARVPAIHGSNSTRDRLNQGKRDARRAPGTRT